MRWLRYTFEKDGYWLAAIHIPFLLFLAIGLLLIYFDFIPE